MKAAFENFLIPKEIQSSEKRSDYRMLRAIILFSAIGASIGGLVNFALIHSWQLLISAGIIVFVAALSGYFLSQGKETLARIITPAGLWIGLTFILWNGNGIHDITAPAMLLVVIIGGLTGGERGIFVYGGLVNLTIFITALSEINGWLVTAEGLRADIGDLVIASIIALIAGGLLRLLVIRLNENAIHAEENAVDQAKTNEELRALQASLEERIEERTRELAEQSRELTTRGEQMEKINAIEQRRLAQFQAVSEVAQTIANIRDQAELLKNVTQVISSQFNFYHVGIFFVDPSGEYALLNASNSKGGQRMLARKHKLRIGEGIVGTVIKTSQPRIALKTGEDEVYFRNPDLSKTRSEMALPLRVGERLIGALDVQSIEPNAFSEDDIQALSTLANQVAIAIENARLFSDATRALAESQTVYQQYLRREWTRATSESSFAGFRTGPLGPQALEKALDLPEIRLALAQGNFLLAQKGETNATLSVPLKVRNEVVGILNIRAADDVDEISREQIELVQAVAERVGLSMENARLFEETSRRAEREKTVSEITSKIRSTNDPAEMLQIALDEIKQALKVKDIRIVKSASAQEK
ncbi:MAG: hypothetical protein CO094_12210 [Anaerolineae bacterium CG_4_9_14_3_um_filter_57_17]|nr:GAF domain-containing protein [bacterium]PJB64739.1 MAG: hypothetical protein CO094_12210 [Anaerolineae bacterium CG_4_9_14_3_um_filter_57_17]